MYFYTYNILVQYITDREIVSDNNTIVSEGNVVPRKSRPQGWFAQFWAKYSPVFLTEL
jgi:hypothetical protein